MPNDHRRALHRGVTYVELILAALRRYPSRQAFAWGDQAMTYRQAEEWVAATAAALTNLGIGKGDDIGVMPSDGPHAWLSVAGALTLGARATTFHPRLKPDDHAFIAQDAKTRVLLFDPEKHGSRAEDLRRTVSGLEHIIAFHRWPGGPDLLRVASTSIANPNFTAEPEDIAFLSYTGGSTGRPKGVMLPHRSLVHHTSIALSEHEWPEEPRFLTMTPIAHATNLMVLVVLLKGGCVFIEPSFSPGAFVDAVARRSPTAIWLVPTMIYSLLDDGALDRVDLSPIRSVLYGASAMSPARLAEALERFGPRMVQVYGQTEAPNTVAILRKGDHDPTNLARLSSCGRPALGLRVQLQDDSGHEVAAGEPGEICVQGPLVMDGYWNRPEETAAALAGGWLHTGDIARFDADGFLTIVDRKKDMIVTGGYNVFPKEVENVLTHHPAVAAAAVIGVPHEHWGEAVIAVVVRRAGQMVEEQELIALVRNKKGSVSAPKRIEFVDEIPLTPQGKPDKKALRAERWRGQDRNVH